MHAHTAHTHLDSPEGGTLKCYYESQDEVMGRKIYAKQTAQYHEVASFEYHLRGSGRTLFRIISDTEPEKFAKNNPETARENCIFSTQGLIHLWTLHV